MVKLSLDEWSGKKQMGASHRAWLERNERLVKRFIDENIAKPDIPAYLDHIHEYPFLPRQLIQSHQMSDREIVKTICRKIAEDRGRIDIFRGQKGSGKTAAAIYFAEKLHQWFDEEIWWFGSPTELPPFVNQTMEFEDIPANTTTIVDEASVQFFSRTQDQEKQQIIQRLPVIRHSGRNFIVITQNTALMDVNFLRLADGIMFKKGGVFTEDTERTTVDEQLEIYMPKEVQDALWYDNKDIFTFRHGLADCWKPAYSTPYEDFENEAEKIRFILKLLPHLSDESIIDEVRNRGDKIDKIEVMFIRMLKNSYGIEQLLESEDEVLMHLIEQGFNDLPLQRMMQGDNENPEYNFEMTPIQEEHYKRLEDEDEDFALFQKRNVNKLMLREIKNRYQRERNVIISIEGETGTGKSYAAISIAEMITQMFGRDPKDSIHIYWKVDNILDDLDEMSAGDTVILDEQPKTHGVGSQRSSDQLQVAEETLRKNQINFIFVAPELHSHMHHFTFETYGIDYEKEVSRILVRDKEGDSLIGYITLDKADEEILEDYDKKKDKFMQDVQEGKASQTEMYEELAREIAENSTFRKCTKKSQRLSVIRKENSELTKQECKEVLNWVEILALEGEIDPEVAGVDPAVV